MNENPEFEEIINTQTWGPYGSPTTEQVKPGLTRRGKAAIAVVGTVMAAGGLLSWSHYSTQSAETEVESKKIALQQQELELEKLKVMSEVNAKNTKAQATADAARQKQVDACVNANKGLVGKQLGATYSSVLSDCQTQYTVTSTAGMQEAASATDTTSGGGSISPSMLLALGVGGSVLVAVAANRGKKTNAA
jgi:hypothetical protein